MIRRDLNSTQYVDSSALTIKICGLTREQDVEAVSAAEADQAGFVFAPSRRRLSILQAGFLIRKLPDSIRPVGVFVDAEPSLILEAVEKTGIRIVQLHGKEPAVYIQILRMLLPSEIEIWKSYSFAVMTEDVITEASSYTAGTEINDAWQPDAWLLDSKLGNQSGGTGKPFNWSEASKSLPAGRLILAGGINVENVGEAIELIRPDGVDCSSGVETDGVKDQQKIIDFCRYVRSIRSFRGGCRQ
ncbi:MAG: phosphoribosylanthranilate isomerase [Clostridiaceae bacterium]|nr:phosphoribosylanthranilate isomerase [Clostridiaceae bacterium]